jgi:hypothetical protein
MEAALESGHRSERFLIVEYRLAGLPPARTAAPRSALRTAPPDPNLAKALRALRHHAGSGGPDGDPAVAALGRLATRTQRPSARPAPAGDIDVSDGRPPSAQGACDVLNRDGSSCNNPGRWPVPEGWSGTTHYKARVRKGLA